MNALHTPGPWAIFDLHDETRINVRGPHEEFVADCGDGFYSDETDDWVMAEESLPNARLIAAAPELLDALKRCLPENVCLTNRNIRDHVTVSVDVTMGELRQIAAVIAKATGAS